MKAWNQRDHKHFYEDLLQLTETLRAHDASIEFGSSGVGEVTVQYVPNWMKGHKRLSSFYVRPPNRLQQSDVWQVKKMINRKDELRLFNSLDDVVEFIFSFYEDCHSQVVSLDPKSVSTPQLEEVALKKADKTRFEKSQLARQAATSLMLKILSDLTEYQSDRFGLKYLREMLSVLIWKYTEADGAKLGNRFWTQEALDFYESEKTLKGLVHEHTVPRKALMDHMLACPSWTEEALGSFLSRFCFATVVTKEEDKRLNEAKLVSSMPAGWGFESGDPFARYNAAKLSLVIEVPCD